MRTIPSPSPDAPAISDGDYDAIAEVDRLGLSKLPPAIFEKDLLITQVLGLLNTFNWGQFSIVFCGGTSLSKGHKLIQRMSEDVDFKILAPSDLSRNQCRNKLSELRKSLAEHLKEAGFSQSQWEAGNANHYFSFLLGYVSRFPTELALRPEIKLEFTVHTPRLDSVKVQVRSLLSEVLDREEAPVHHQALALQETLMEKVVAFLRRTATWSEENWPKTRRSQPEDERLVRHLYDVQQLLQRMPNVIKEDSARQLFEQIITTDRNKYPGKDNAFIENPAQRLANALEQLNTYSSDFEALYRNFVSGLVWGPPVGFSEAHRAFSQLACHLLNEY